MCMFYVIISDFNLNSVLLYLSKVNYSFCNFRTNFISDMVTFQVLILSFQMFHFFSILI